MTMSQTSSSHISHQEMEIAVKKIERRIEDLNNIDVSKVTEEYDPVIRSMERKLDELLVSIFGLATVEYQRHRHSATNLTPMSSSYINTTPVEKIRSELKSHIKSVIIDLESVKEGFVEELEDAGKISPVRALKAYQGLELHPKIGSAASQLFRDGHYSNAVEDAVKALYEVVQEKSEVTDQDGTNLMEYVFRTNKPILRVSNLTGESGKNEQKGLMMMFSGAVSGLRHPRAHKIIKDDPEMALEFIAYISMLAKIADASELNSPEK